MKLSTKPRLNTSVHVWRSICQRLEMEFLRMRKTLGFLYLVMISPAAQAATCTIEEHPSCTISCTAGCIASWVEPAGCATRCSEAEGVKTIRMIIQDASSKEIGTFMKSKEFLKLFKQK
jgi:hypothetical protein